MRYLRSYQFIFDSPQWLLNVLFGVVCQFIPVIGHIVWLGYQYDIIEFKHRRGDDRGYPEFTFNQFVPYLTRGVWPFLVNLIVSLPLGLLFGVLYFLGIILGATLGDKSGGGAIVAVVMLLAFTILIVGSFLIGLILIPMYLRAGLSQDFAGSFSVAFVKDFLGRTWKEILLVQLFLMGTSIPLMMIGLALCFVGLYPAAAILGLAAHHLHYQLYELYLERGGEPIPLKESATPAIVEEPLSEEAEEGIQTRLRDDRIRPRDEDL